MGWESLESGQTAKRAGLSLRPWPAAWAERHRKPLNPVAKPVERLGSERFAFTFCVTEPRLFHLRHGLGEPAGTDIVHIKETECLGNGYSVRSAPQEFNLRRDFSKHRVQGHLAESSIRDRAFGKNGRAPRKGKTLNDPHEVLGVYCE